MHISVYVVLLLTCYLAVIIETHSMGSNGDVSNSSISILGLFGGTVGDAMSKHIEKGKHEIFVSPNLDDETHRDVRPSLFNQRVTKHQQLLSSDFDESNRVGSFPSSPFDLSEMGQNELSFTVRETSGGDPEIRSAINEPSNLKTGKAKGKQKASSTTSKVLGRLLMNSGSSKSYDDLQDDYPDDEDDDYSKNSNGQKMNWEDYQNEDGASVMELVALDARHKKRMERAHEDFLY